MNKTRLVGLVAVVVAGLLVVVSASTVPGQVDVRNTDTGSALFKTYCASCHGVSGRGDGSIATFLKVPPANLTEIAKRNKGVFPADEVYRTIEGRRTVKVHGESQMPVWGDAFAKSMTGGDQKAVDDKIRALVDYLQSIQEKPAN